jgi:acetyltransferase-like isoleucine patch superfamily enzyme
VWPDLLDKILVRLRPLVLRCTKGVVFARCGQSGKFRGTRYFQVGKRVSVGDFCWLEAVDHYCGQHFTPSLVLGDGVAMSDMVHISCAQRVTIGQDVLVGSKVYIGDHSHGARHKFATERKMAPGLRPLGDLAPIDIGDRVWICDGAVILAGSEIASESIVAANSVVRLKVDRAALIGGAPARVIRYL